MPQATWSFAVTDLPTATTAATVVDYLDRPVGMRYIRRRNGYCELELDINNEDDIHVIRGAPYRRGLVAFRDGIERFFGWIIESHETSDGYTIGCRDPYYVMSWRRLHIKHKFLLVDPILIANVLINDQNVINNSYLHVRTTIPSGELTGTPITRTWDVGDVVAEKVEYLMKLDGGPAFKIDAQPYGTVGSMSKLTTTYDWDAENPSAVFAYGDGTLANCIDFERTCIPLMTASWVSYTNGLAYAESVSGMATYGKWEDQRGQVTTDSPTIAEDAANHTVMDIPRYDVSIIPGPDAPALFDDFDVFDSVPVVLRRHGRTILGNKPVTRAAISLDPDSGYERFEEIVVIDEDSPELG